MRGRNPTRHLVLLLTLAAGLATAPAQARSVLSSAPSAAELRSQQLRQLAPYRGQHTLRLRQLSELLPAVTGRPSLAKYIKYGGNFRRYWRAGESAFVGKGFEAIVALRENSRRAATGQTNRLLVTAAEGFGSDAADIVDMADDGRVLHRFQAKLGAGAAKQALFDARYTGMTIITTPESFAEIRAELARQQVNALRRGIVLDARTQHVAHAVASGRLTDSIAHGIQAPSRREAARIVRHQVAGEWRTLGRRIAIPTRVMTTVTRPMLSAGRLLQTNRVFARGLLVADVGLAAYRTYGDFYRYRAGEISGGYLAFKASLRSAQVGLTIYATVIPADPASKGLAAFAAGACIVLDTVSDPLHALWHAPTDAGLLAQLENHERASCVRQSLLGQLQQLATSP